MKKIIAILSNHFCLKLLQPFISLVNFLLLSALSYSQTNDLKDQIMQKAIDDSNKITMNCMVLDAGDRSSPTIKTSSIDIFEAGENVRCGNNECKKYYYSPYFYISKFYADSTKSFKLRLEIMPSYPERSDIIRYIQGVNSQVKPTNINPICITGFNVYCENAKAFFSQGLAGITVFENKPFGAVLQFSNKSDITEAVSLLSTGFSPIGFSYRIGMKLTTRNNFEFNESSIAESDVYKDFFSPVEGKTIWIAKKQIGNSALKRELKIKLITEINSSLNGQISSVNVRIQKQMDDFINLFFNDYSKTSTISFEEIEKGTGAAKNLEDFTTDKRYSTDLLKKIAYKAKNSSNKEWESYYENSLKKLFSEDKTSQRDAGGGGWFKAFGLKGNYSRKTTDNLKKEYDALTKNSKKLKDFFENSFDYEKEGEEWIPKGIISTEIISAKSNIKNNTQATIFIVDQIMFTTTPQSISLNHD